MPIQTAESSLSSETFPHHEILSPHSEDDVVKDEAEDVLVEDENENVVQVPSSEYWDVNAIRSTSRLLAGYSGRIIRMFKDLSIVFENWKAIPTDKKTKFYDAKIKLHFVVDDGRDKDFILASAAKKWRDDQHHLFHKFYRWDLTLEENLANYRIYENDWAIFGQYRRKEET
ncbi:hypothetical protein KIW84_053212 [Lathyrus oleraceus]|uniref:Uncharacterized protein n=1 Tax=Pisum sativum TaxID=3888 RepID=A0A9D4WPV0_PEA|nr:hypothetical protein KIW84_053212 [Pisum sativum]